ncbi:MAG: response regulator transcription factor [Chloroflexota bacterium]|nr:response regulator transcription factor [Chloroflexota bacterium]
MATRIMIVEDDEALIRMLATHLEGKGFEVVSATRGREALRLAFEKHPALILLDVMMPGMDGWQTCERLRELSDVPIIMITAKAEETDLLKGFRLGADDYITKPFSLKELLARIHALLRRADHEGEPNGELYDDGYLRVDLERHQVFRAGELITLTPTEYRLLECLVENKGRVIPHQELLERVWGPEYAGATDSLALYVRYLRKKLEENPAEPHYILNRWGMGYWFHPGGHAG